MKILDTVHKLCFVCMEMHYVDIVEVPEQMEYKDQMVSFTARYEYCSRADQLLETEEMIKANWESMKGGHDEFE